MSEVGSVDLFRNVGWEEGSGEPKWKMELDTGDRVFEVQAESVDTAWSVLVDSLNMWASDEFLEEFELVEECPLNEEGETK